MMNTRVEADIIGMLRHIVCALQAFAKMHEVDLSFQSDDEELIISYEPEEISGIVTKLICRVVAYICHQNNLCWSKQHRTQLYRKLQPIIRQAPGCYIQTLRIQKAKELLETTDMRVGEVAFKTGFQTPSHFTRIFIKHYGVRPSLFCRQTKNVTNR